MFVQRIIACNESKNMINSNPTYAGNFSNRAEHNQARDTVSFGAANKLKKALPDSLTENLLKKAIELLNAGINLKGATRDGHIVVFELKFLSKDVYELKVVKSVRTPNRNHNSRFNYVRVFSYNNKTREIVFTKMQHGQVEPPVSLVDTDKLAKWNLTIRQSLDAVLPKE